MTGTMASTSPQIILLRGTAVAATAMAFWTATPLAMAFSPASSVTSTTSSPWLKTQAMTTASTSTSTSTNLKMAWNVDPNDSNMFEGPAPLVKERDACGVGFIANTKNAANHKILTQGLSALTCMEHRGACGGDFVSGDGAGIMTQIPWDLLKKDFEFDLDVHRPGVGMIFLPQNKERREKVMTVIEDVCKDNELEFVGWREVPVDNSVLGPLADKACPTMYQFMVLPPGRLEEGDDENRDGSERTLYLVRRRFNVELENKGLTLKEDEKDSDVDVYVASFSSRTIVYKGMVQGEVLPLFYKDLKDAEYKTQFVLYHRRFSTNTNPKWQLAQPMRVVGHNGEINTLLGNVNWVKAREAEKGLPVGEGAGDLVDYDATNNIVELCNTQDIPAVLEPVVDLDRSDSANLDSVFELMTMSRHRAPCALMAMVPTAYENTPDLANNPEISDFYKFHGGLLEAWDGPALLVYSDGKSIGASLDRNGLRPARYSIDKEGTVYMMSETGVVPELDEADIVEKGRLGPGQMINVDLTSGEFKDNIRIKSEIASRKFFILETIGLLLWIFLVHSHNLSFGCRTPLW